MLLEAGKVVEGLFLGAGEIPASTLLLDEEHALPEQVDESSFGTKLLDGFFEAGDAPAGDAESLEKLVVESLAFPTFVMGILPFLGKAGSASSDLVPTEAHRFSRQSETLIRTGYGCRRNCIYSRRICEGEANPTPPPIYLDFPLYWYTATFLKSPALTMLTPAASIYWRKAALICSSVSAWILASCCSSQSTVRPNCSCDAIRPTSAVSWERLTLRASA